MKKIYDSPEIEMISLDAADAISVSAGGQLGDNEWEAGGLF